MNEEKIFVTQSSMPPYEEYVEAIKPLWSSRWLTNMGEYHKKLELELKKYLGVKELSLFVNGHMALELAIQMFDFPEGGEIITTPFTFISTTHAIVRNHLVPVFCDVKTKDVTFDETKIEELITEKTVAILPVHVYGNICNIEEIQKIAIRHSLKVIYDAAHAFGEKYKNEGIGNYGDATIFSFHATKVYNTIEGGAVTFSNPEYYDKLYNLKNFGIRGEEQVVSVGANAKMNELQAIMGLCNLKHIEQAVVARKERFLYYREHLQEVKGIRFFDENKDAGKNYAYFPILIEDDYAMSRDALYDLLRSHNIYARKYFYPITADMECYASQYAGAELSTARKVSKNVLTIPFYEKLEKEQMNRILQCIKGREK